MNEDKSLLIPLNAGINDSVIDDMLGLANVRASKNTRFTVDRGVVRKAPASTSVSVSSSGKAGATLLPLAGGRVTPLLVGNPNDTQKYVRETGFDDLVMPNLPAETRQNGYFPLNVTAAGSIAMPTSPNPIYTGRASLLNGENLWIVSFAGFDDRGHTNDTCPVENIAQVEYGIYATCINATTGEVVAPPQLILDGFSGFDAVNNAVGSRGPYLTAHKDTGKVVLWYVQITGVTPPFTITIHARELTLSGSRVNIGTDHAVATGAPVFAVSSEGRYGEGFADHTWLLTTVPSSTNKLLRKVDMTTYATSDDFTVTSSNASEYLAVSARQVRGGPEGTLTELVSIAWEDDTVTKAQHFYIADPTVVADGDGLGVWTDGTLTALCDPFNTGPNGPCSVTHYHHGPNQTLCALAMGTGVSGNFPGGTSAHTVITLHAIASNTEATLQNTWELPWLGLYGQSTSYCYGEPIFAEFYGDLSYILPAVPLIRVYNQATEAPGTEYVLDQALAIFGFGPSRPVPTGEEATASGMFTPIARLGTDQIESLCRPGRAVYAYRSRILATYAADAALESLNMFGQVTRYAMLDTSVRAVRSAFDDAGISLVAGAQPVYWDGFETVEICPLFRPLIDVKTSSGDLTGAYSFTAIYAWVDGAGQTHRSAPAKFFVVDAEDFGIDTISVTWPFSFKDGFDQLGVRIELYCKSPTSNVHTLMSGGLDPVFATTTDDGTCVMSGNAEPDDNGRALYTELELENSCPNAAYDLCVVGQRAWLIDAERRGRAQYSKLKKLGVAFEFPAEFELVLPPSAGLLTSICEVSANPVMIATNGVYAVLGPGPNDDGSGVEFADPRRISDVGCRSRESVVRTPEGTIFASRDCFAFIDPQGGVSRMVEANPNTLGTIVGTALFEATQEVLFFGDGSGTRTCLVYNYEVKRWSEWTHTTLRADRPLTHAILSPREEVALVAQFLGTDVLVRRIPPEAAPSQEANTHVVIETGWMQPLGPQAACTLRDLVIEGYRDYGQHGLALTVSMDYSQEADKTLTFTWTAEDITDATENGRYTLMANLGNQNARAVKCVFTETDGPDGERGAFCPLHATLVFGQSAVVQRDFKSSAIK